MERGLLNNYSFNALLQKLSFISLLPLGLLLLVCEGTEGDFTHGSLWFGMVRGDD